MSPPHLITSRHVAVIGAGAAGLVAARELHREGHQVVVFEQQNQVGGTWIYDPRVEPDPLGLDPNRPIIHSSLYCSLRTNIPREAMGFMDFPFLPSDDKTRDPRRFPGHQEVLAYLQDFANEFQILKMVRFETEVIKVGFVEDNEKWKVRSKTKKGNFHDEIFDAVVVCNGHFTQPRVPQIQGMSSWPGKQLHSHNYRTPENFKDQVVIVIGNAASAIDISREIAVVAKEVHVSTRSVADETYEQQPGCHNLWLHSMIECAHENGSVVLQNGRVVVADIILHCTGYKYHFPFLETNGIVTVDDNRVGPLYKHVFPPALAPGLSFVGLPMKVIAFAMFELQSKWIAGVLSGRIVLPLQEEMMEDIKAFYSTLEALNIPKHYTHMMPDSQFECYNWLASQCGCPSIEEWREKMFYAAIKNLLFRPDRYRDEWEDDHLILQSNKDFTKYTSNTFTGSCISLQGSLKKTNYLHNK